MCMYLKRNLRIDGSSTGYYHKMHKMLDEGIRLVYTINAEDDFMKVVVQIYELYINVD